MVPLSTFNQTNRPRFKGLLPDVYLESSACSRLGIYPVQSEVKRRWIDLCREAASCDDPDRADDLLERITTLISENVGSEYPIS